MEIANRSGADVAATRGAGRRRSLARLLAAAAVALSMAACATRGSNEEVPKFQAFPYSGPSYSAPQWAEVDGTIYAPGLVDTTPVIYRFRPDGAWEKLDPGVPLVVQWAQPASRGALFETGPLSGAGIVEKVHQIGRLDGDTWTWVDAPPDAHLVLGTADHIWLADGGLLYRYAAKDAAWRAFPLGITPTQQTQVLAADGRGVLCTDGGTFELPATGGAPLEIGGGCYGLAPARDGKVYLQNGLDILVQEGAGQPVKKVCHIDETGYTANPSGRIAVDRQGRLLAVTRTGESAENDESHLRRRRSDGSWEILVRGLFLPTFVMSTVDGTVYLNNTRGSITRIESVD